MPLHGTDCQAALVSELHWLHRGQQKDCPFTAHPPGFIYLTAPSFQWHDYVLWQLHFELRIPLLSCPIPSGRSKAFVFAWWGFSFFDAMPYQQTQNALNLNTPTLLSSCSVKDKHPAFFIVADALCNYWWVYLWFYVEWVDRDGGGGVGGVASSQQDYGSSQHQRSPLFTVL